MKANEETEESVMKTLREFYECYSKQDWENLEQLLSRDDDVAIIGTGIDEKRIGLDQIKEQAKRDWSQSDSVRVEFGERMVSTSDLIAWVIADRISYEVIKGKTRKTPSRITAVLEYRQNKWVIMQLHHSRTDPKQFVGESFASPI